VRQAEIIAQMPREATPGSSFRSCAANSREADLMVGVYRQTERLHSRSFAGRPGANRRWAKGTKEGPKIRGTSS